MGSYPHGSCPRAWAGLSELTELGLALTEMACGIARAAAVIVFHIAPAPSHAGEIVDVPDHKLGAEIVELQAVRAKRAEH